MKTVSVQLLTGGEYLAKPVKLKDNQTLYYEGTCLYMKHIETLVAAGVYEVCIFEPSVLTPREKVIIKRQLQSDCSDKVKNIMESHVNQNQEGLEEIAEAAQDIIDDIFNRDEVVDRVYDIKERSCDLYDHSVTVAALSILTALKMNLSPWEVTDIGIGSLMHDMGLRYLTISYKDADMDDFSPEAVFEYKKHTLYGFSSVEKESWMSVEAKNIILFHHEKINGTGYPFKQKATSLPVRIVAIVDAFDDIMCGIGCRKGNVRDALEYIKSNRDIYFDGRIVDYFLDLIAAYPAGTLVITNKGDEAVVIEQNEHFTDRPKIRLIQDWYGKPYEEEIIINLVDDMTTHIESVKSD